MHAFKIPITPETENPRWTRCRHAIGREPQGWEFMVWMGWCWSEFRAHMGVRTNESGALRFGEEAWQDAFDRFQDEGVAAGRWSTPDGHLPPVGEGEAGRHVG